VSAGRAVWVKVRTSEAERAEWHAKSRSAGFTLSDLVRRSLGRASPLDRGARRGRARAHPASRADRKQPRPDRSGGEHAQGGGRGRRGDRRPDRHQAGARGADTSRTHGRRCSLWFLARGTGSAGAAADYLLGERDAAGKPREGVEVLRGDPHQVAAVADTLPFEHKLHVRRDRMGAGERHIAAADRSRPK